jgi:hypothetical protein
MLGKEVSHKNVEIASGKTSVSGISIPTGLYATRLSRTDKVYTQERVF